MSGKIEQRLTRRGFLAGTGLLLSGACAGERERQGPAVKILDFHVHLFGSGDGGSGCRLSEEQKKHINYRFFLKLLSLEENGRMDEDYIDRLLSQFRASKLSGCVLLAQDCRYDKNGKPDFDRTGFYVPNDWLFEVCGRHKDIFFPCVSINPKRRDHMDELERCAEKGAKVLKIHPPTQDVDPGEERFRPFYRRMAEHGIVLMVHTGTEHASAVVGHEFSRPLRLAPALEEGCTVVAAHAGMASFFDSEDFFPELVTLMHKHERLFCDSGNLAAMLRWRNLPRILAEPLVLQRLLHASDFPFPANASVFWHRLRPSVWLDLLAEENLFDRDIGLKRALGFPDAVLTRGWALLS